MKYIVTLILFMFPWWVNCQPSCNNSEAFYMEDIQDYDHLGGVSARTESVGAEPYGAKIAGWYGMHVALVIERETINDRDPEIMEEIVSAFDRLIEAYEELTLHRPGNYIPWRNRIRMEINYARDGFGAGGAHHNQMGIHAGIEFFETTYNNWVSGVKSIDHVFFYEFGRNYWYHSDTDPISFQAGNSNGHWVAGWNNLYPMIFVSRLNLDDMTYYNWSLQDFIDWHLSFYDEYVSNPQWNWDNVWTTDLLPWNQRESLNNLVTAMLYDLYQIHGYKFIEQLWFNLSRFSKLPDPLDYEEMRSRFYIASCLAANQHLTEFFDKLKWDIPNSAIEAVDTYLSTADNSSYQNLSISYEPFDYPEGIFLEGSDGFYSGWSQNLFLKGESLAYPGVTTTGGALVLEEDPSDEFRYSRSLDHEICSGSDVWLSFLLRGESLGNGACMIELGNSKLAPIGKTWGTDFAIAQISTGIQMDPQETYFILAKTEVNDGDEEVYMWVNPGINFEPESNTADVHWTGELGPIASVNILYQSHGSTSYIIDEIRVGDSWAGVTQEIDQFVVIEEMTTSTNDIINPQELFFYPNPVSPGSPINIEGPVRIYDLQGRFISDKAYAPILEGIYILVQGNAICKIIVY